MAAEAKQVGVGALIEVDKDISAVFVTVGCVFEATPPPRSRSRSEGTSLTDTVEQSVLGIEEQSDFTFEAIYHPGSDEQVILEELFTRDQCDVPGSIVPWRITYPHCDVPTETFNGQIVSMVPGPITRSDLLKKTITIERVGAITVA